MPENLCPKPLHMPFDLAADEEINEEEMIRVLNYIVSGLSTKTETCIYPVRN
ncbi:MAG: hypothetical protein R2744_01215 [Bacteroidales bacterium]